MVTAPSVRYPVLATARWRARRAAHERRVDGWLAPHLARRAAGAAHPVEDFLFTYYSYRPAQLRRWHPGADVLLAGAEAAELGPFHVTLGGGGTATPSDDGPAGAAGVDVAAVLARRRPAIARIARVLSATAGRAPQLGCFGMHEWAMVYRQPPGEVRHASWPLRLTPARIAAVVEERGLRCTHYDAYRFFTAPARPLNLLTPTRDGQPALEQPGCLHANMDLYKYAYRLAPLTSAELVADCFALAREIRALDMRASPYDLRRLGYPPVPVETADGRAEYAAAQRTFAERAAPLRQRLLNVLAAVLPDLDAGSGTGGTPG